MSYKTVVIITKNETKYKIADVSKITLIDDLYRIYLLNEIEPTFIMKYKYVKEIKIYEI